MDNIFIMKLLIYSIVISLSALILGIVSIIRGRKETEKNIPKIFSKKVLGYIFIVISMLTFYNTILDFFILDFKEAIVKVVGINSPGISSFLENEIVTEKDGIFTNTFRHFDFSENGYYEVKYTAQTKILIDAKKINDNQP